MTLLLDSDVIFDFLRGHSLAVSFVDGLSEEPATSVVVVAELYAGVRDGSEQTKLETLLAMTTVISLTPKAAVEGGLFRRTYGKSHGAGLDDCLIGATTKLSGSRLGALNAKHFPMLADVLVPYSKT